MPVNTPSEVIFVAATVPPSFTSKVPALVMTLVVAAPFPRVMAPLVMVRSLAAPVTTVFTTSP